MKSNNILLCWLAFSVLFSATFVQLHHIEHIVDNVNNGSISSQIAQEKIPLDAAIDQCNTCHQCAHISLFIALTQSFDLSNHSHFSVNNFLNHCVLTHSKNWSALQPRAPPAFLIS
ncbi:hypothetical protein [Marinicellulosiphila megalodicopiae]|uniref:hypothetical protein n=1 Tax=Marinicellulosiphila megalodicopiae TaxID=2724896 RepID=UPI003BB1A2E5